MCFFFIEYFRVSEANEKLNDQETCQLKDQESVLKQQEELQAKKDEEIQVKFKFNFSMLFLLILCLMPDLEQSTPRVPQTDA